MSKSWDELVEIEPRLGELLTEIRRVDGRGPKFCANKLWYGQHGYRRRMEKLVGWGAEKKSVSGSVDYDTAYKKLYRSLPDCKHEGGFC